jgi:hypothetical protein
MTWNLFIDDERTPEQVTWGNEAFYQRYPWVIARTIEEMKREIYARGFPDFISFDHDLNDNQPTGKDCANWLINYDIDSDRSKIPDNFQFFVHSKNPIGKQNIEGLLNEYLAYR